MLACVLASSLVVGAASCGRTGGSGDTARGDDGGGGGPALTKADFQSLTNVCQPGDGGGDTAQGVTAKEIKVGVVTDFGFTQNREFINAAEAFTKWCNDAGGINGRKLGFNTRDAKLFEYRQRIVEACKQDFFLVGGGAAFDGSGTKDRLKCLLPEIPGQTVSLENRGSDLQVDPMAFPQSTGLYPGYFRWLVKEAHPESNNAVGLIVGDVGVTKILASQVKETFDALGSKVVYNDVYPPGGVPDWTPYAQAIKSAGAKGLVFFGDFKDLAKLEQSLTDVGATMSWIDANSNAYRKEFLDLVGANVGKQTNYADTSVYPLENAADNPATKQLVETIKKYVPEADITKPVVNAWSAWLLFATAARDCGAQLTRKCVYDKARAHATWDGAGLHQPTDLANPKSKTVCFNAEKATPSGWQPADFKPNNGAYRCGDETFEFKGDYPKPVTLADVGKSPDDLK
jgi:ABC-type branched-subunit amino acid transport system substrate-binding protein